MLELKPQLIKAIEILTDTYPYLVFGGSLNLVYRGLIARDIGDLDIFIEDSLNFEKTNLINTSDNLYASDFNSNFLGLEISRSAFKVNDLNVCCFTVPATMLEYSLPVKIGDLEINLQNPVFTIASKLEYAMKKYGKPKHKFDMQQILKTLK